MQWNKRIDELEGAGIKLVMVSVGSPENCQKLVDHLEIRKGYLYVDPDNTLYDELYLNRGVKETFFSVSTPFAFLERLQKPDGFKDLGEVLSKWNKAFFVPPKQDQAFLQGGTFVLQGDQTLWAHYDKSTAAHADLEQAVKLALEKANNR